MRSYHQIDGDTSPLGVTLVLLVGSHPDYTSEIMHGVLFVKFFFNHFFSHRAARNSPPRPDAIVKQARPAAHTAPRGRLGWPAPGSLGARYQEKYSTTSLGQSSHILVQILVLIKVF